MHLPAQPIALSFLRIIAVLLISSCTNWHLPKESGAILFQDDFSSPSSGWSRYQDQVYFSDYHNGSYRISISQPNVEIWALPGLNLSDVMIDVKVTKISGPDNNSFGVLCRYRNPGDFYFFIISSDGYGGIGYYHQGQREMLSGQPLLPNDAVIQGNGTNALRIECHGPRLALYANGQLIHEVQSSLLETGDVGVFAGTYDQGGTELLFNDFLVRNP